jgi:predicted SAM-dependent methyltransferase
MGNRFRQLLKRSDFLVALVKALRTGREEFHRVVWLLTRSKLLNAYATSHQVRKLQIGTGSNFLKGWLNTDYCPLSPEVAFLDAAKPFPFQDATFDYVFSEHLIEHLTYPDGLNMLREANRVLKPGGKIRIATPNLENLISLYAPEKTEFQKRYIQWTTDVWLPEIGQYGECFVMNNFFRNWGHVFIYDSRTLQLAMKEAGFTDFNCYPVAESDDESLRGLEFHGEIIGVEINQFETMVLEAVRPK